MYRTEQSLSSTHPREGGDPESAEGDVNKLGSRLRGNDGGEDGSYHADIATAIEQHYKPQGPSDAVPTNPVAVAVALADKLDTLVGFWAIDEKPTGSKDPFALRRAALGVVRIILENDLRIRLTNHNNPGGYFIQMGIGRVINQRLIEGARKEDKKIIREALNAFGWVDDEIENPQDWLDGDLDISDAPYQFLPHDEGILHSLMSFIADRLKVYLKDKGIRHDLIDAVFALGEDDLVAIVNRVTALQSFLGTSEGENLLAGYKRAANILKAEAKKGELPTGDIDRLSQPEAVALQTGLTNSKTKIEAALASESYSAAMTALSELRGPIDAFFDNVMVVAEDKNERENNLRLLGMIRDTARQIADFDRISG